MKGIGMNGMRFWALVASVALVAGCGSSSHNGTANAGRTTTTDLSPTPSPSAPIHIEPGLRETALSRGIVFGMATKARLIEEDAQLASVIEND